MGAAGAKPDGVTLCSSKCASAATIWSAVMSVPQRVLISQWVSNTRKAGYEAHVTAGTGSPSTNEAPRRMATPIEGNISRFQKKTGVLVCEIT